MQLGLAEPLMPPEGGSPRPRASTPVSRLRKLMCVCCEANVLMAKAGQPSGVKASDIPALMPLSPEDRTAAWGGVLWEEFSISLEATRAGHPSRCPLLGSCFRRGKWCALARQDDDNDTAGGAASLADALLSVTASETWTLGLISVAMTLQGLGEPLLLAGFLVEIAPPGTDPNVAGSEWPSGEAGGSGVAGYAAGGGGEDWSAVVPGALFCAALTINALVSAWLHSWEGAMSKRLQLRAELAVSSCTHKAVLLCRTDVGEGTLATLGGTDAERVPNSFGGLPNLIVGPLQFVLALILLWHTLGVSALAALAVALLFSPLALVGGWAEEKAVDTMIRRQERRVRVLTAVLRAFRPAREAGMDVAVAPRLKALRAREVEAAQRFVWINAGFAAAANGASVLMALAALGVRAAISGPESLTPEVVFPSLMLLGMLEQPISDVPSIVAEIVTAKSSFRRLGKLFARAADDAARAAPGRFPHRRLNPRRLCVCCQRGPLAQTAEPLPVLVFVLFRFRFLLLLLLV
ncbi:hypothetical protein FNF28_02731 [Cafeteria roenbergensis]|uniref:ABC transmembrane type-1 domain-containing protein n=1 Tax=Cafeteria roenbergensis TaxID=33653 RepID=A0A5A8DQM2_CAFRO|nr:hypothetical protein FNF28_02731 [Cafeteria roenbergensis]